MEKWNVAEHQKVLRLIRPTSAGIAETGYFVLTTECLSLLNIVMRLSNKTQFGRHLAFSKIYDSLKNIILNLKKILGA